MKSRSASARADLGGGELLLLGLVTLAAACVPPGQRASTFETIELLGACGAAGLIDDGEDGNNQTKPAGGRGGYWYTYIDGTGSGTTVWPPPGAQGNAFAMSQGGVNGSRFAARAKGRVGNAKIVYAAMGMNFTDPMAPYDASKYNGISFWAKKGPDSFGQVRFKVPDVATHEAGGVCRDCSNDFGVELMLGEAWQHFVVTWRRMKQLPDWGAPRPHGVKAAKVFGLQWQVSRPGASFDIWVDDISFIGCE